MLFTIPKKNIYFLHKIVAYCYYLILHSIFSRTLHIILSRAQTEGIIFISIFLIINLISVVLSFFPKITQLVNYVAE